MVGGGGVGEELTSPRIVMVAVDPTSGGLRMNLKGKVLK